MPKSSPETLPMIVSGLLHTLRSLQPHLQRTTPEAVWDPMSDSPGERLQNLIGSHDSDSQLGTTPVVSGGRMLIIGPARPKRPTHWKQGRNEAVDRPNQRSTARWNPRSQPGARGREEFCRPSGPGLFFS